MNFNDHSKLRGLHALLSPSQPSWLNYNPEDLIDAVKRKRASSIGTTLHELAASLITEKIKLTKSDKKLVLLYLIQHGIPRYSIDVDHILETLIPYVNDAIGFRMYAEKTLYFSDVCFGTVDSIIFNEKNSVLRIHDLKTGVTQPKMEQLLVYAALYLLEYGLDVSRVQTILRIYQNGEVVEYEPPVEHIVGCMKWIEDASKIILDFEEQQGG